MTSFPLVFFPFFFINAVFLYFLVSLFLSSTAVPALSFLIPRSTSTPPLLDSFCNLDIPAINVELDGILDVAYGALHRHSVVMAAVALEASAAKTESEEDSESTIL